MLMTTAIPNTPTTSFATNVGTYGYSYYTPYTFTNVYNGFRILSGYQRIEEDVDIDEDEWSDFMQSDFE